MSASSHNNGKIPVVIPPYLTLTDMLIAVVLMKLEARRKELDAMQFGTLELRLEVRDGEPSLLDLSVAETETKHKLAALLAGIENPMQVGLLGLNGHKPKP